MSKCNQNQLNSGSKEKPKMVALSLASNHIFGTVITQIKLAKHHFYLTSIQFYALWYYL